MNEAMISTRSKTRSATWAVVAILAAVAFAPSTARADEDTVIPDARLTGFTKVVDNGGGSTALTWVGLAFMGMLAMSPMFKDAKRSHLD